MVVSFGRLLLIVNSVLIAAALVVSLIFSIYFVSPRTIENFAGFYLKTYMKMGHSRATSAIADLHEGDTSTAHALLRRWDEYQEGDRYYTIKRNVAIELAQVLEETGAHQESVDVIKPFLDEDDRDLVAFNAWASAALEIESLREEAAARVVEYWSRFPESEKLGELYLRKVYAWDDPADARKIVATHGYLTPIDGQGWEVFWADTKGFTAKSRKALDFEPVGSRLTTEIELPKGTQKLRIDPPNSRKLEISNLQIHLQGEPSNALKEESYTLNMMTLENGVLKTSGGEDPFIVIDTSKLAAETPENIKLVMSMNVTSSFAAWLKNRMEEL